MKLKKLVSAFVAGAMVLGTVSISAFAVEPVEEPVADEILETTGDVELFSTEEAAEASWIDNANTEWYNDTDTVFTLTTAEQLAGLAKLVIDGNNFSGKTIKLGNDIDLAGKNWTPIGTSSKSFYGIFDGQNYKISNLSCIPVYYYSSDRGFFGFTKDGAIKNFTIENATIKGYLDVGVVAGSPYTSSYSNIKVIGDIKVDGFAYVGGAFGKNVYADITNVDVDANSGSYVYADSIDDQMYRTYVGGLAGFVAEGNHIISDCDVKIDVSGTVCDIGGLIGILHYGNTMKNCTYVGSLTNGDENTVLDPGDETEFGAFVGTTMNATQPNYIIDCTATVISATQLGSDVTDTIRPFGNKYYRNSDSIHLYSAVVNGKSVTDSYGVVAKVGNNYYSTLADALNVAESGSTIEVLEGTVAAPTKIEKENITLVGAGKDLTTLKINDGENLTISANNVTIKNLSVIKENNPHDGSAAISITGNNTVLENMYMTGGGTSTYGSVVAVSGVDNVTFKDCTITGEKGGFRGIMCWGFTGNFVIDGCTIDPRCYPFNFDSGTGTLTVSNSNLSGWTSYTSSLAQVTFEKCKFSKSESDFNYQYDIVVAYTNTTLKNCEFDANFRVLAGNTSSFNWIVENCIKDGEYQRRGEQFFYIDTSNVMDSDEITKKDYWKNQTATFIFPSDATVIDTAKTTGAEITLNNLYAHANVDVNEDATYKVVVSTAPADDAEKANEAIKANTSDNNKSKAIFDISVVKTDSNGTTKDVSNTITQQQVTLTLGETPIVNSKVFVYHVDDLGDATKVAEVTADGTNKVTFIAPSFSTYAATYTATTLAEDEITKNVGVAFERVGDTSEYNIVLKALDTNRTINRFMSADLTFDMNVTSGAVAYTVNPAASVNLIDKGNGRYEFNLDGLTSSGATGTEVTIGTVTFEGSGTVKFGVKTEGVTTNIVNTAKATNNIVDNYTTAGDGTNTGKLVLNDTANNGVINATFTAPTKDLTVNIAYNNAITNQAKDYQAMTVTISGGDLTTPLTYELGKYDPETNISFTADPETGVPSYTVKVENILTKNTSYTVTVEGLGYRTARHTVTMTANKELNFWNNVKDAAHEDYIEDGVGTKVTKNFLAGDIVKDNQINIYDLSAVVSYFGTLNNVNAESAYARYDLNRDGKIDSKDVAYVLVSWNN